METISLNFKFKGSRTYVHGTDIFNLISKEIKKKGYGQIDNINVSFHSIIKNQVNCFLFNDEEEVEANITTDSLFKFKCKGLNYKVILEESQNKVRERYEYPDQDIISSCSIDRDEKTIDLLNYAKFSNIEKIVAMNKALLETVLNDAAGKWYFTKLKLTNDFEKDSYDRYSVKLVKNMNYKLTKSAIYLDGISCGFIYFSLV